MSKQQPPREKLKQEAWDLFMEVENLDPDTGTHNAELAVQAVVDFVIDGTGMRSFDELDAEAAAEVIRTIYKGPIDHAEVGAILAAAWGKI